ncbi:MAG: TetR/AcrR family transcriptional regulator [Gemmiger sp.]|nr:TetR/AcrR family transcriptional regulator [Gemmiger sp.]
MNAKGDANRSVRQTKRRLCEALVALLATKPARQITVRELTTLAGVSRGTFYFHYCDIYDLLEQIETEQLTALHQVTDGVLAGLDGEAPPPALEALFCFLQNNEALCSALIGPNGDPQFVQRLKETISRQVVGHFEHPSQTGPRAAYLAGFAVNGCLGSVEKWLQDGRQCPPPEMARLTWHAIRAVRSL